MTSKELCMPPTITFLPNEAKPENSDGTQIFEEGVGGCRARDEEAQGRYVKERSLGQEGQEPQTGDCDRSVRGEGQGQEGAEEGIEEAQGVEEGVEEKDGEEIEAIDRARSQSPSCPGLSHGCPV
jgi:hypothetical protein